MKDLINNLDAAYKKRAPLLGVTEAFRIVNGAPDGFPGIEPRQKGTLVVAGQGRVDAGQDGLHRIPDLLRGRPDSFQIDFHGVNAALGMAGNLNEAVPFSAGGQEQHGKKGEDCFFHFRRWLRQDSCTKLRLFHDICRLNTKIHL